jgi:hypothetical protein
MYLIRRRRGNAFRRAALAQLTQAQREQFNTFVNKALGWFTVAASAAPPGHRADLACRHRLSLADVAVVALDRRHARRGRAEHGAADDPRRSN